MLKNRQAPQLFIRAGAAVNAMASFNVCHNTACLKDNDDGIYI
jgi:hypothetical protein